MNRITTLTKSTQAGNKSWLHRDLSIAAIPAVVAPVATPVNTVGYHCDSRDGGGCAGDWCGSDHSGAPHASSG